MKSAARLALAAGLCCLTGWTVKAAGPGHPPAAVLWTGVALVALGTVAMLAAGRRRS